MQNKPKKNYRTTQKAVIFGGHNSWRTALGTMVTGSITFANLGKRINKSLVRHADVVWIQSNAYCHSSFRAVTACAKQSGVPVKFFLSGGAERCAAQLAEYDRCRQ